MGFWRRGERFFSSCRLEVALALPLTVVIVLNLVAELVILSLWGSDRSLALSEWSSVILPIFAFVVVFGMAIVAVVGQLKRTMVAAAAIRSLLDAIRSRLSQLRSLPRVRRHP